ncbi:MAG: hypothetical protein JWN48_3963 [Myxococcaceae bacterium]|nr:hypothetical protein [Myxococcaceae bacterium]
MPKESEMQNVTVWSMTGLSAAVLLTMGACHNRPGARHGHTGDLDRDRDHDEHGDERHEGHSELGAGVKANHAVHAIAKARCEREEHCGNIGAGKSYTSMGACEEKIRADWAGDLNKYECPKGTNKEALDKCLGDVRTEECGNPFDTLSRVVSCSASDICDDG